MAPLLLTTCSIHWLARPHVIGWLFLLGAVLWAERARGVSARFMRWGWRFSRRCGPMCMPAFSWRR